MTTAIGPRMGSSIMEMNSPDHYRISIVGHGSNQHSFIWNSKTPEVIQLDRKYLLGLIKGEVKIRPFQEDNGFRLANAFWQSLPKNVRAYRLPKTFFGTLNDIERPSVATIQPAIIDASQSEKQFKKLNVSIQGTLIASMLALGVWNLMSNGQNELANKNADVIPPQFAKILLKKSEAPTASSSGAGSAQKSTGPTKATQTAVAKTFRSGKLMKAMQGLLSKDFSKITKSMATATALDMNSNAKSKAAEGLLNSLSQVGDVALAGVGGGTGSGAGGGVGYGSGSKAGIAGQGKGIVSLDLSSPTVQEGLSKEEVGKVIHAHLSEIRYCYESTLLYSPDLEGKMVLDFTINGNGLVKTSKVKAESVSDPRLDGCILRRLAKWEFPKPRGGVDVDVSYPVILKAIGR